jgi:hypothetical protein
MKAPQQLAVLMGLVLVSGHAIGQATPGSADIKPPTGLQPWEYTLTIAVGYNFVRGDVSAGDNWELDLTPMLGGVLGRNNGIAPGCEVSLSYRKKVEASISSEYVFTRRVSQGTFTTPGRN